MMILFGGSCLEDLVWMILFGGSFLEDLVCRKILLLGYCYDDLVY